MRLSALAFSLRFALSLTALCCVATASPDALAQASKDPLSVLIDQGKYWQTHHRGDLDFDDQHALIQYCQSLDDLTAKSRNAATRLDWRSASA